MHQDYEEANKPIGSTSSILGTPKGLALIKLPYQKNRCSDVEEKEKWRKVA